MANVATSIVLLAGTATFANEWYVTGKVNWRVPIATLLAGAAIDGLSKIDNKAGVGIAIMVMIGALATKFNGQSVIDTLVQMWGTQKKAPAKPHLKVA